MHYIFFEKNGEKPVSAWLASNVKAFVKEYHGLEIRVLVNPMVDEKRETKQAP